MPWAEGVHTVNIYRVPSGIWVRRICPWLGMPSYVGGKVETSGNIHATGRADADCTPPQVRNIRSSTRYTSGVLARRVQVKSYAIWFSSSFFPRSVAEGLLGRPVLRARSIGMGRVQPVGRYCSYRNIRAKIYSRLGTSWGAIAVGQGEPVPSPEIFCENNNHILLLQGSKHSNQDQIRVAKTGKYILYIGFRVSRGFWLMGSSVNY